MERKAVSAIMLTMLLIGMLTLAFNIQPAKAQSGTIYIMPDGSINSPVPANITTSDKVTYTFTGNNYLPIMVERNNIVIDGNGCVLQGNSPKPGSEGNGRGIDLSFSDNVTVRNVQIENFFTGIYLCYSSNETISGNKVTANTWEGISLQDSSNNTISGNVITNNTSDGIGLWYFSNYNNIICGNSIENNTDGIIDQSSNIIISDNKIAYNQKGLCLNDALNNTIIGNTATANGYGIYLNSSSDNKIYHNSFVGNVVQVSVDSWSVGNIWDNGYPSGGNYWSDYRTRYPNASEIDSSGIWNTSYVINACNQDHYPFMSWYSIPPTISLLSPENKTYDTAQIALFFTVSKNAFWIGYSIDGGKNVTITGNTTLTGLADGLHSIVVYANSTTGNVGFSDRVYFSIRTQQARAQSNSFPAIVVALIIVAAVGIFMVYFVKVKKITRKTNNTLASCFDLNKNARAQ